MSTPGRANRIMRLSPRVTRRERRAHRSWRASWCRMKELRRCAAVGPVGFGACHGTKIGGRDLVIEIACRGRRVLAAPPDDVERVDRVDVRQAAGAVGAFAGGRVVHALTDTAGNRARESTSRASGRRVPTRSARVPPGSGAGRSRSAGVPRAHALTEMRDLVPDAELPPVAPGTGHAAHVPSRICSASRAARSPT